MYSGASIPERVFDKVRECQFFLVRMDDYEKAGETENFLFCLSAFLFVPCFGLRPAVIQRGLTFRRRN